MREASEMGQVLPMDSTRRELEARGVFALMDGLQLQWLLDPSLDAAGNLRDAAQGHHRALVWSGRRSTGA